MARKKSISKKSATIDQKQIVYDDQIQAMSSTISTKIEGSSKSAKISSANVNSDTNKLTEETIKSTITENISTVTSDEQKTSCPYSDAYLTTTLVTVRILGDRNKNGLHHMCVKSLAKAVATNNDKNRIILTSPKTAEDIYLLVINYPEKIDAENVPSEMRKVLAERFKYNLKRYKF